MGLKQRADRLAVAAGCYGSLTRQDRRMWARARTLDDLGELTARWLEGRIDSRPGYHGQVDVDEDLAPGMTAVLVALNRAGYVTFSSEGGWVGRSWYDGRPAYQHAGVNGFATPQVYERLHVALAGSRFRHYVWSCKPRWGRRRQPPVDYGWVQLGVKDIASMHHGCSGEAIDELCQALQVHIYDPVPGRNSLWRALRAGIAGARHGAARRL